MTWYYVMTRKATFAIIVNSNNIIVDAAPYAKRLIGKTLNYMKDTWRIERIERLT